MPGTIKYLLYMLSKMRAYGWLIDDIESNILFNKKNKKKYKDALIELKKKHNEIHDLYKNELFLFRLSKIKTNNLTKDVDDMDIEDYFTSHLIDMNTDDLYKEICNIYLKEEIK